MRAQSNAPQLPLSFIIAKDEDETNQKLVAAALDVDDEREVKKG